MDIRRLLVIKDRVNAEGGLAAVRPVTRVAVCAVIHNPLAGQAYENVNSLVPFGAVLGEELAREALELLDKPVISYGKGAIVGTAGDVEHGAAIVHPQMGKPMRAAIGGGKALIPSNVKVGAAGESIDVPLGNKDDPWSFDEIDTITVQVPGAPRSDEIVVVLVFADGGRPRPRLPAAATTAPATPKAG
jgi:hypothetical protein